MGFHGTENIEHGDIANSIPWKKKTSKVPRNNQDDIPVGKYYDQIEFQSHSFIDPKIPKPWRMQAM